MEKYFIIIIFVISISTVNAFAIEPIMITISNDLDKVVFDGKWSHTTEWKHSSLNTINYDDGTTIQLRTAHQDNFIYVFVDAVSDTYLDKGADRAMFCFDGNNDKTALPNTDDYCFIATVDRKQAFVYQGGSPLGFNDNFKKISNHEDFIGIGSISDVNDRYSVIPHSSYEFRIPTDLVGRSSIYGFYLAVYDAHSNKVYSWPSDIFVDKPFQIPSPSIWGELVSPDKSLPEFEWPMFAALTAISLTVYLTKFRYR